MRYTTFLAAAFCAAVGSAHPASDLTARLVKAPYIFATFRATDETKSSEKTYLDIYTSDDGINYTEFAKDVYKPATGLVRDPSIIRHNGKYYIAHTTGWNGKTIGIIVSDDLRTWKPVTTIDVTAGGAYASSTWAPVWRPFSISILYSRLILITMWQEFFRDPKDVKIHIIVSLKGPPTPNANPRISPRPGIFNPYIMTAKNIDLNDWSPAAKLDVKHTGNGASQSHIDFFVIHDLNDKATPYHAFQKNEDEKHIEHLTSASITGPWNFVQTNDFAGWGKKEGAAVTFLPDGKWVM